MLLIDKSIESNVKDLKESYKNAAEIPHIVMDKFLLSEVAECVYKVFLKIN